LSEAIRCPICSEGKLLINTTKVDIPYYGLAYLLTIKCDKCSFKTADVILDKVNPPTRYTAKVKSIKDQEIKVVKSSTAVITIPEIGVKMEPGIASEGMITNIEGILLRFKDLTNMVKGWLDDEEKIKKCDTVLEKLKRAVNGEFEFTLILEDPNGNSLLVGEKHHKITKELLSDEEIKELQKLYKGINES